MNIENGLKMLFKCFSTNTLALTNKTVNMVKNSTLSYNYTLRVYSQNTDSFIGPRMCKSHKTLLYYEHQNFKVAWL